MRANKFFLTRRLWNKGLLFKTCLMLILSTSASLASICSLVHGNCEDYDARGTSHPAYVGSDVSNFVSDKQDGISGCAGFSDKGAAPHANGAQWPAYARKNSANNTAQYVCSACKKTVNNSEVVVVDAQGYARWNCYRKCDDVTATTGADYVADYGTSTVSKYANRPYRDRFVRSQAQCNEKYSKAVGANEWPTKYVEITPNVCGKCKPVEELTDDEKCDDGLALSSYPTDYPCYYACKKPYTLKDGTECCAASSWEKMPEDYHREFWTGKCYNTKTEEAASGGNCYKQTEIRVRTATASAPLYVPMGDDEEDWGENTSGTTSSGSVERETDEDEVVCDAGKVWNDYNKSYDSAQEACACVFEKCEGNTVRGGEDGVTCVACGGILQANADHTACRCPEDTAENDSGECVCKREGAKIVDGTCMCPAGTYATTVQRAPNCPPGRHCSLKTVMVCIPCDDDTYTGEPNLNASCTSCSEGFVPNEDHTACVCANGGELIDGVCRCADDKVLNTMTNKCESCPVDSIPYNGSCQCKANMVFDADEFACKECENGIIVDNQCEECGEGFVPDVELGKCVRATCGMYKDDAGNPLVDSCTSSCVLGGGAVGSAFSSGKGDYLVNCYEVKPIDGLNCFSKQIVRCPDGCGYGNCSPCAIEGNCQECPTGSTLSDDGSKCVCDNGGELKDGKCVCVDGKVLYNGQCTDPCGSGTRTAKACSEDDNSKVGNTCNFCSSAGFAGIPGSSATMQCYMRGTETCEEGYEYNIDSETCAAQGKYILYSTKSSGPCGPCAKCVDDDPCVTKKGEEWSSEPCTSTTEGYTISEEDDKCYYCNNNSRTNITVGNSCYHHEVFDMGPTEAECAARGAIRKRGLDSSNSPCGLDYVCECPDGAEFDNNNQCVCKNGGRLLDGKCVAGEMCVESADCNNGKVCKNKICIDNPCVEQEVWDDSDGTCVVRVEDTCSESEYPYVKEGNYSNSRQCISTYAESSTACIIYTKNTGKIKECTSNGVTRFGCADGYVLDGTNCVTDEQLSGSCKRINPLYLDTCEPKCSNGYLTTCKEIKTIGTVCYITLSSPCKECNEKEGTCSHKTCAEMGYMEQEDCSESCTSGQAVSCTSVSPGYGLECVEKTIKACLLCNGNKCSH